MEVTITLTICLSLVFVITLGIVSCTLRDQNFKARFDKNNKRLKRIVEEQHRELISYREAIKKNDANLKESLQVLASASDVINTKLSRLKESEELLSMFKVELGNFNLGEDKISKKMDEAMRSFSSCVKRIEDGNEQAFKHFEQKLVNRPSYLSPEEKKQFKEYLQACSKNALHIDNMPNKDDFDFVTVNDVVEALNFVGTGNLNTLYIKFPEGNGQNPERNQ